MRVVKVGYMVLVYLFLYLPVAVLMVLSINRSKYGISWQGISFRWYADLISDAQLLEAAFHSLTIAFLAASLATALGTTTAIALYRYRFRGKGFLSASLFVLIMAPDIVLGVALLILFLTLRIDPGFWTLLLSHMTFCFPFVAVTVGSRLQGFDPNLVEAAQDLGAGEFSTFRHVILPLIMPAVLAGWLMAFTLSLDDVIISFFVTGPGYDILPLRIYAMVKLGVKPVVNALCTLMVAATVLLILFAHFLLRRKNR